MWYVVRNAELQDIPAIRYLDQLGLPGTPKDKWFSTRIKKYGDLFFVAELVDEPGHIISFANAVPYEKFHLKDLPQFSDLVDCGFLSRGVTEPQFRRMGVMRNLVNHIENAFCDRGITRYSVSTFRKSNMLSTLFHYGVGYRQWRERCIPYGYKLGDTPDDRFMVVVAKPLPCHDELA